MSQPPDDGHVPYDRDTWEAIVAGLNELDIPVAAEPPPPPPAPESDDDRFIPPEPPPLPHGDAVTRAAWAGVIGGPALLLGGLLLPGLVGPTAVTLGVAAFLVGFVTLVVRSKPPAREGWEDGSEL